MLKTRRLCAVMLDTLGREVFVRRSADVTEDGWLTQKGEVEVARGGKVTLTVDENAKQTNKIFPVNYNRLPGARCGYFILLQRHSAASTLYVLAQCTVGTAGSHAIQQPDSCRVTSCCCKWENKQIAFAEMMVEGDQLYIGRYLVTGADAASLYLEVKSKTDTEVECVALNDASLSGLLTVFHMERNVAGIVNKQNEQPLFAPSDTDYIEKLSKEFDVDFLSLSYCRTARVRCRLLPQRVLPPQAACNHCQRQQ